MLIMLLALASSGGVYLTGLICRLARRRVGWHWALVGTIASGLFVALFFWLGCLLQHGELGKGVTEGQIAIFIFVWASGFAFVPAVVTVWYYRRKFATVERVA